IARDCPSLSWVMAAQAAVDSRSGPASAHSETRRPKKYTLSPMTAIRLTSAARASSLATRNSLCAPRPGATASVPSGRSLTPPPPPRSPPRARHDEHLAPAPLVVHQVRVDGGVPRLGGPNVAVVPQGVLLAHAGREHLV